MSKDSGCILHTTTSSHAVTATSADAISHGSLVVTAFGTGDRLKRAGVTMAKWLGITALCIFIPVAHFVLVPVGLLVITPLVTTVVWRTRTKIVSATIECPKCRIPLNVLTTQERYPFFETCGACHRQVTITKST